MEGSVRLVSDQVALDGGIVMCDEVIVFEETV